MSDCHTVRPLDEALILQAARETGALVTAENNIIYGGLGGAVAKSVIRRKSIGS